MASFQMNHSSMHLHVIFNYLSSIYSKKFQFAKPKSYEPFCPILQIIQCYLDISCGILLYRSPIILRVLQSKDMIMF